MHVVYEFTGKNLPLNKLQKAVELSEERYCGVSTMYKKVMEHTSEISDCGYEVKLIRFNAIAQPIYEMGLEFEYSIRIMTDDERNRFLQLEAEAWKG